MPHCYLRDVMLLLMMLAPGMLHMPLRTSAWQRYCLAAIAAAVIICAQPFVAIYEYAMLIFRYFTPTSISFQSTFIVIVLPIIHASMFYYHRMNRPVTVYFFAIRGFDAVTSPVSIFAFIIDTTIYATPPAAPESLFHTVLLRSTPFAALARVMPARQVAGVLGSAWEGECREAGADT